MIVERISDRTRQVIRRILEKNLGEWKFADFDVVGRPDSYGDPAIYITAWFETPGAMPASAATTQATLEILDALRDVGDERLPFLYYRYPELPESDEAA